MQQDRQRQIRALFDAYIDMYATRDERLFSCFSQDITGFTGSSGRLIKNQEEFIRLTRKDFLQLPGRLRLDPVEVMLQELSPDVVSVAATLHIHLPDHAELMSNEITRLVLVFRQEGDDWKIAHCSYSVPFHSAGEDEIYPIRRLQEENIRLQALVAERTRKLHESQEFYRQLTEDAEDVLWRMDRNCIMTYVSPSDERLRGFRADEVIGLPVFSLLTDEAADTVRKSLYDDADKPADDGFTKFELQQLCKDGSLVWGEVLVKTDRNEQGDIIGYHGITRNITERKRLEQQVQQMAFHDPLTQLPNRRLLLEHLGQALAASQRNQCYGALLYIDLDNFKPLNDTEGHGVGDLLLIEVAMRLKDSVREDDTVARVGGDEFVVLLHSLAAQRQQATAQALAVAEKIGTRLAERYVLQLSPAAAVIQHHCTASIGVALFHGHTETQDSLMTRADRAMYQAKADGRNRIRLAAGDLNQYQH